MKNWIALLLLMFTLLGMSACSAAAEEPGPEQFITAPTDGSTTPAGAVLTEPQETAATDTADLYCFTYEGVVLTPGEAFDASVLPQASSVYQVPSCAIEGSDNVYSYEAFEVTAFDDGNGERIYSIFLIDPNLKTAEGLALGDPEENIEQLYGSGYTKEGTAYVYTKGNTVLFVIVQNESVASIEYRYAC